MYEKDRKKTYTCITQVFPLYFIEITVIQKFYFGFLFCLCDSLVFLRIQIFSSLWILEHPTHISIGIVLVIHFRLHMLHFCFVFDDIHKYVFLFLFHIIDYLISIDR